MKAIDYFRKYNDELFNPPITMAACQVRIGDLFEEFGRETIDICKKRNVSRIDGLHGVVKEQNNKWNTLVTLFEKDPSHPGISPIEKDGFTKLWLKVVSSPDGVDYYSLGDDVRCGAAKIRRGR